MKPKYKIGDKLVLIQYCTKINTDTPKDLLTIVPFIVDKIVLQKEGIEYYATRGYLAKEEELLTKNQAIKQFKEIF